MNIRSLISAGGIFGRIGGMVKRHHRFFLFLVFLGMLAGWAFISWEYGWRAVYEEQEVSVRTVEVKAEELHAILERQASRTGMHDQILQKEVPNPFRKAPVTTQ